MRDHRVCQCIGLEVCVQCGQLWKRVLHFQRQQRLLLGEWRFVLLQRPVCRCVLICEVTCSLQPKLEQAPTRMPLLVAATKAAVPEMS